MWSKFEGIARNRADTLARIQALRWTDWKPEGITLHNTAAPTLKQWAETGPAHDARIRNLENYYENELGWHAGPHFFVSRNWINWFSNPLLPGVHSRCWNSSRFGIEMVGDFAVEPFDSGDGAMVRDNAVFLIAALNLKFGFNPDDLTFHKECKRDNHDCPGKLVKKPDVIALVKTAMGQIAGAKPATDPAPTTQPAPAPTTGKKVAFEVQGKMSTFGGPDDRGMSSTEPLAFYETQEAMERAGIGDWLLSAAAARAPGIGRRLKVEKPYVACRWDYAKQPKSFLRTATIEVTNPKTGKIVMARAVDWGPHEDTGRVADLSPGLAKALGLNTDDTVRVRIYEGA